MGLSELLREKGALLFGNFTLTSGRKSAYYVNIKRAYTDPHVLDQIAAAVAEHVTAGRIAGVALGAIPIVVAVALRTGKPFSMIRKEDRHHGTSARIEGDIAAGETVDLIEDVTTTGGSVVAAVKTIRAAGGRVDRVIVVVDRGEGAGAALSAEGVDLKAVISSTDLGSMLSEANARKASGG